MKKIVRSATLGTSLNTFCDGILCSLRNGVLGSPVEVIAVASQDKDLDALSKREGVQSIGVPMERHISPLKDFKALFLLIRVFLREKPDMVHSMTPKAGLLCMMAAWLTRVPVRVHTFTGLVWPTTTGMTRRILMATDWLTCACATHVIPEGQGVLDDLAGHITKKPLKVLGYGNIKGIDLSYWRRSKVSEVKENLSGNELTGFISEAGISDKSDNSTFTFLFVGRIVGDKGINELISAFVRLQSHMKMSQLESVKPCRLVLVGRYEEELDPVRPETRQLIDSTSEIEAVGPQFGDDLFRFYMSADCFVFPSYREGFPNTVLEAGAMELPCIVTDINGSNEIICNVDNAGEKCTVDNTRRLQPGETISVRSNGVVIPSKNEDALYDAMLWMMQHPEKLKEMGQKARQIIAERWEQSFVREQLFDFYRKVLG